MRKFASGVGGGRTVGAAAVELVVEELTLVTDEDEVDVESGASVAVMGGEMTMVVDEVDVGASTVEVVTDITDDA